MVIVLLVIVVLGSFIHII